MHAELFVAVLCRMFHLHSITLEIYRHGFDPLRTRPV